MLAVVIPLGLLAALFYALSDFLEQRAASNASADEQSDDGGPGTGTAGARIFRALGGARRVFRRLVRDKQWLSGWAVGTLAYLVQAAALHLGSVGVVQSLQTTSLLFALPLSAVGRPERIGPRDVAGGLAITGGLLIFLIGRGRTPATSEAHRERILLLLLVLGAAALVLTVWAALHSAKGPVRAVLLGVAAGLGFASSATLVKLTTHSLTTVGVSGTARDWPGYALALATGSGLVLQQLSFASGRLATASTAMILANPVAGTAVATVGFGEHLPSSGLRLAGIAVGAVAVIVGVVLLSHSDLIRGNEDMTRSAEGTSAQPALPDGVHA